MQARLYTSDCIIFTMRVREISLRACAMFHCERARVYLQLWCEIPECTRSLKYARACSQEHKCRCSEAGANKKVESMLLVTPWHAHQPWRYSLAPNCKAADQSGCPHMPLGTFFWAYKFTAGGRKSRPDRVWTEARRGKRAPVRTCTG